jgi:transcriptional regulator with PAS, ATPase and Fis domain
MDYYSLRDLALLQAIARLTSGALLASRMADQIGQAPSVVPEGGYVQTRNARVQEIFTNARRAASTDVTVLISGESGTGKEVLARHIHESSPRFSGPFVAVNCSAIPSTLFESELFGYERGAFTGAVRTTPGKIEAAHGGTLFLDEIGDLDLVLQPKLLRFIQEKVFYRLGGTRALNADVRILAATNQDLAAAVKEGRFRSDLWYRLNVMCFNMPPLRERREDIAPLVDHFVSRCATAMGKKVLGASDSALAVLQKYDWPGNIRELANATERAVLLSAGRVLSSADFAHIEEARRRRTQEVPSLAEVERDHIITVLRKFDGNQVRAAEALGVHRNTLRNKIIEYGLRGED